VQVWGVSVFLEVVEVWAELMCRMNYLKEGVVVSLQILVVVIDDGDVSDGDVDLIFHLHRLQGQIL
jgi:hypothetical protein